MTHVVIRTQDDVSENPGHLEVEGFDLSDHISARHLRIEYPETGPPLVHVAILADVLDAAHVQRFGVVEAPE